jgi:hypothetical protein
MGDRLEVSVISRHHLAERKRAARAQQASQVSGLPVSYSVCHGG